MTETDFATAIKTEAYDAAVVDAIQLLRNPPGAKPRPELVRLSDWFLSLPESDQQMVADAVRLGALGAAFGVLAMLDGVRVWENSQKGDLRILSSDGTDLNPNHDLHDRFRYAIDSEL